MAYSKYLNESLDEHYLLLEPGIYEEGPCPDEELELENNCCIKIV